MIQLYQFPPTWGLPSASPFCLKLQLYCRMADIPYEIAADSDVRKAPKKKLPYIQDQGKVIADSNFIIDHLENTHGTSLDSHLTAAEKGLGLGLQRMVEENLFWVVMYSRWVEEKNWKKVKPALFDFLPPILNILIPKIVRKQVLKDIYSQGMGRHNREEVYEIGIRDLQALSDVLGDKTYLLGDQASRVDTATYGLLANILWTPVESPLKEKAESLDNLVAYCQKIRSTYFSEASDAQ